MSTPTIGWSQFAIGRHTATSGNSYFTTKLSTADDHAEVILRVKDKWPLRKPGDGEGDCLDRKILVPVPPEHFYCPPRAKLVMGMPVQAEVVQRQEGEEPFVEKFVTPEDAEKFGAIVEIPAAFVDVVLYSAEALLENDGERSTDCEWEIVCILARQQEDAEPMPPLTMARNQLEMAGGTAGHYTSEEYAKSIWYHANKGITIREPRS